MLRLLAALFAVATVCSAADANGEVDFQRQVRPILSDKCFLCHGPDPGTRMVGLRLDIPEGAFSVRKNGSPVVPGKPDQSLLIQRIYSNNPGFRMPPVFSHKTLTDAEKDTLRRWIVQGAKWSQHWAFVPPRKPALPEVKNTAWPRNEIDRFILAKAEEKALEPAAEADRRTLIRRVTLDLIGLPATPAEVDDFIKDKSPRAYERVVDRLLTSPHYGEHRAHYWLDAARYADTNGLHFDNYREMWPYRDWVIHAFNANMRFDQFTVEQLAGDLLPHATLDQKIASGFERCGETTDEGGAIQAEVEANMAKDRTDTMGTVWLGLTVGCATCHDHKFDPISQKDYYSLTSFFRNTTQTPMDLNVQDTPPAILVAREADRKNWELLTERRDELARTFDAERMGALKEISAWLDGARAKAAVYAPESQVMALEVSDGVSVRREGDVQRVAIPKEVEISDAAAAESGAIRFEKDGKIEIPAIPAVDSNKPFTIAAWVFLPNKKEDGTVISQLEPAPSEKEGEHKRRGWILKIDKGNLGLYDHAPAIYFYGAEGKGISARPIPQYKFKPDSWYHLSIAYDGGGETRGIYFYVNGAPVTVIGRPEDGPRLTPGMASSAPVLLGMDERKEEKKNGDKTDEKQDFPGGAIADLRVLSTMAGPADVELLYLASRINAAGKKAPEQLSDEDKAALATFYTSKLNPATAELATQIRETDEALYPIKRRAATTLVMQERTDTEPVAHVLYRGQYDQMRDEVHPNTPSVLPPMTQAMPRNRLGLAMWIVDPANPLTARVTVNRFWQEIFGTGIVKTAEDFGSQGEPPSHAELLDWLAVHFRDSGWDVKRLFKMMVMSATYRQSAVSTPQEINVDPQNRLLARGPRFRMDAEMVRDYALAASGLLRPEIGGPSVKPYQPSHIWDTVAMEQSNTRNYQQDNGDNLYRRSLYTFWKRAAPPPSMDIFNAPSRETCMVRRERTDSPLQALVTMNDVQFVEAARVLAQSAMQSDKRLSRELGYMSARLLARPLGANEMEVLAGSYKDFLAYYTSAPTEASKLLRVGAFQADASLSPSQFAALTMVANEMLNMDETLVK
jgi:Protein of unknown function (DUF1553)/Protein of unknown function (DUF1549)/Planctomycete cytochrome C/Concanavalin A-like lectin/glucanases superfamily